jgi:ABC-2 type transport system permease protein
MKSEIGRYIRIYAALVRFSVSRSMEFRFDFFFRFFMDILYYAVSIAFFKVIFLHTPELGGWSEDETLLFLSMALLVDGIFMTLVAHNMWEIPALINKGELDYLLMRPVKSLFLPLFKKFEVASLLNVLVGLGFFWFALENFQGEFGFLHILSSLLLICLGVVMFVCLRLFAVLPVFWTHSPFGFHMLFEAISSVMERPEVLFRGFTHFVLVTILPFLVITSFPARVFFGDLTVFDLGHMLGVLILLLFAVHFIWNLGLRSYSSASS